MAWQDQLKGDGLSWLLSEGGPGVHYLALRDLLDTPADDPDLCAARQLAYSVGPMATVLDAMDEAGYWVAPGPGDNPKYRAKQDAEGRWSLEYDYTGKTWGDFGTPRQPNPWVTLRALRVLKAVG